MRGSSTLFNKILVANRSEIAIRILRAANELGLKTVAVYTEEDKLALHRFKSDEAYKIGSNMGPIEAYLSIDEIIRVAKLSDADAIHPGYGFLSENPDFADRCKAEGIIFIGPKSETMRLLGDKVSARKMAIQANVPVVPASRELPRNLDHIYKIASEIGYPLMLKASWGGGGRGMRMVMSEDELEDQLISGRSEALKAFGRDEVYLEKLVQRARHIEVQVLGDKYGNIVHLFERDCSVQRRHQKVVERAPAPYLEDSKRQDICETALRLMSHCNYENAGTVEFLMDIDTGEFYFIEVNPRVQVEHTVTEEITGIDIVAAQIKLANGGRIGHVRSSGVPNQGDINFRGCAIQARITSEDPESGFIPDHGHITAYRGAMGFGVRLDGGTAYSGALITRHYDSLLEKLTVWATTPDEAIARMDRALREFRIRGVATNIAFLENLINHEKFIDGSYTTRFIDETPELFNFPQRKDRATRLLSYIADVSVNGHPLTKNRPRPAKNITLAVPTASKTPLPRGMRDKLQSLGPEEFSKWVKVQPKVLITDTSMRDAHQSLLATRMRSFDIIEAANRYAQNLPELFSLECWGGATFDVAMRFLQECPWERLKAIRRHAPNMLLQMLLRASNAVGYKNYADNVVEKFIQDAAETGIDVFRVFDSLNDVSNMRIAIQAVIKTGTLCEAAICYTGDILTAAKGEYDLDYYVKMARALEDEGAHFIAIKDMAGLVKPKAAHELVSALKSEVKLPLHFHTHDTSGIASASILAAIDAGVDVVDLAMDSLSGHTSQPNLGSIIAALEGHKRDPEINRVYVRQLSDYWENVRAGYRAFESDIKSSTSDIYRHEMPGGQYTNLKEQARSLGLGNRWDDIANTYADVNMMFGNIPKVTPSSKVVGDMALAMISAGVTRQDIEFGAAEMDFPNSVISFFRGELGVPPNGFPEKIRKKVLKGTTILKGRPGDNLPPANLLKAQKEAENLIGRKLSSLELSSYLMYPKVFITFAENQLKFGPVDALPTHVFFYGMEPDEEINVDLDSGKTLNISFQTISQTNENGIIKVFFELNGQPRVIKVLDRLVSKTVRANQKADNNNASHIGAPLSGIISDISVVKDQTVKKGEVLLRIEAMKMETTLTAERNGSVEEVIIKTADQVEAGDLLLKINESAF